MIKTFRFAIVFFLLLTPIAAHSLEVGDNGKDKKPGCHRGEQDPPKPPKPPQPDSNAVDSTHFQSTAPVDPNEIIGPDGWMAIAEGDTVRWVNASQSLPYTIYFENDLERATAAAQVVTVWLKLHPLMNMADFGIGTFGFGNHVFPVEGAPLQYQTRLDLTEEMNLYVDVVAGIDITTNEAFWIFSSIDPETGVAPTESERGFLAVNDSTHVGEGFVTFTIKPRTTHCHTGDTISAQASIVFDINDPIMTNKWVNTIDAVAPTSSMTVVREIADSIYVAFNGNDDATGMDAYRLYYTAGQSAYRLAGRYLAGDTAVIATEPNTRYTFFSLGEDNVGNIEPMKDGPDTLFGNTNVQLLATVTPINAATIDGTGTYSQGDTATLTLHTAEGYRLLRWIEAGVPQGTDTLLSLVADGNHSLVAELERVSYPLTVEAAEGTSIEVTSGEAAVYQMVKHFDTIDIHLSASPCYSNVTFALNDQPLTQDTALVVTEAINITSSSSTHIDTGYVHDTICPGYSYNSNGFNILSTATQTTGSFKFHVSSLSSQGCDSVAQLSLYVKPSHTVTFHANDGTGDMTVQRVCEGDAAVLNQSSFVREGYYFAGWAVTADASSTQYSDGDIINTTNDIALYAVWSSSCVDRVSNRMVTICDNYSWHGQQFTASGEYRDTVAGVVPGGCDSIYQLHLTLKQSSTNTKDIVACQPYTWIDGQTYTTDTSRILSLTNSIGCDSIIILNLTISDAINVTEMQVVCDSLTWRDGITYYQSTDTPTLTALGEYGCDSVTTLHLTVNHSNSAIETVNVCDSYSWHGTTYSSSTNTPTFTSQNVVGCDSVTTLNLTVNYNTSGVENVIACDSYTWHGITYTTNNNSATFIETNAIGCDSVVTLNLTVNYSSTAAETVTACDSYTWHGTEYTISNNTATYSTTNTAGCDSVTTLNLTVNYSSTEVENITACDSYEWHGTTYTASGTHMYQTTNAAGCDSVTTLNLIVNYSSTGVENITACDNYAWHGTTYTVSTNTPTYTTENASGCDSVVTLNLTINNSNTGVESVTACDNFSWHGTTYTASTNTPTYTTENAAGCDSTVTLNLTINYSVETTVSDTAEGNYTWNGMTYTESGTYQWQGSTTDGCDSTVTLILVINNVGIEVIDENGVIVNIYPNPTTGWITIDADDVLSVKVYDQAGRHIATHDNTNRIDLGGLAAGNYILKIHLQRGNSVQRVILK